MARRWARVKGIMDRMDWDKEVEMEVEVEEEFVVVVILCNANAMQSTPSFYSSSFRRLWSMQVPMGITYIIHHIISPRVARGCSAAKCVILAPSPVAERQKSPFATLRGSFGMALRSAATRLAG